MNNNERIAPEALARFWPYYTDAHERSVGFIEINNLKTRLSVGSKIGQGLILEDVLATEIISEQISAVDSRIRQLRSGKLSKRRVLGAYTRHAIRLLVERVSSLSLAFGYMVEETKLHRETYCRTPAQLESAEIVANAVDELILIANEKGVSILDSGRFKEGDLKDWQGRYREKLYAVS